MTLEPSRDAATLAFGTLGRMIAQTAQRFPDHCAVRSGDSTRTYRELTADAARLVRGFPRGGTFCALFGGRGAALYAGVVAAVQGDRTYLPLVCDDPLDRLIHIARQTRFDLLVADASAEDRLQALLGAIDWGVTVLLADHRRVPGWCAGLPRHRFLALDDLEQAPAAEPGSGTNPDAYLLFTSGSTGEPKGVLVSHANVLAYVANIVALYRPDETDRFSQLAPLSFDFSVHDLFVPWRVGACVCAFEFGSEYALARYITDNALTFWASVPSTAIFLDRLGQLEPGALASVRVAVFCGEALKEGTARAWSRAAPGCRIDNIYGPTETTVAVTAFPWHPADDADGIVPIGWAFDGVVLRVAGQDGDEVAAGETGELWIAGDQVARGYWHNPRQDAERFVVRDGLRWYRTGDLVRRDPSCGLRYVGRIDDQMQVRGQRMERLEVETLLQRATGCGDVAVVGWPVQDRHTVESLVFFVGDFAEGMAELRRRCHALLPRAMWPSKVFIGPLPKNRNGKTDYGALRRALLGEGGGDPG